MLKKTLTALAAALILLGPSAALIGIGLLMNPAATATCVSSSLTIGTVPDSLTATTRNGETITLNRTQLTHAATIITIGAQTSGVGRQGALVALMAALTESSLRMLSNTSAYPESANFANDGDAHDHDSLGLFQMRPAAGWGTVAELMDPVYQAKAFYGGPDGPNHPSPRGLLDIPGWQQMDPGEAAQAVEVSAYPDRYQNYQPVAETILATLTTSSGGATTVPETSRVVFPLPTGTWVRTSGYGWREDPFTGERTWHAGTDYAAEDGTPIHAIADGHVLSAVYGSRGGVIVIEHTIEGQPVTSTYVHMWEHGIHVTTGQQVTAGQHIGDVGNAGRSTGAHLHLEIRLDGTTTDPDAWLTAHDAQGIDAGQATQPGCAPGADAAPPSPFTGSDPDALVDDPTSSGQITALMAHVMTQTRQAFPDTGWACWDPHPQNPTSDHPRGRACDITVGNQIGTWPTATERARAWEVTTWLQTHAASLGVKYLIFDGQIWTRTNPAWRPYTSSIYDVTTPTGGHHDHIHLSVN